MKQHTRFFRTPFIAISLALAGFAVPAAYADTLVLNSSPTFQYSAITVTVTSPVSESFSDGGAMNVTDQTTGKNILMYCVDVVDSITIGQPTSGYQATPLSQYSGFSSTVQTGIEELFTKYLSSVTSTDTGVAFQEALWKIIYANTSKPYSGTADSVADTDASNWVSNLGTATNGQALTIWSNGTNQTLISDAPIGSPEPSTWGMLVLGLGIVFLAERRRRTRG